MNRTIKDATVKRFHYDSHHQLRRHLQDFIDAYNCGRRLQTLTGLTPYEFICKQWTSEPDRFIIKIQSIKCRGLRSGFMGSINASDCLLGIVGSE